MSCRAGAQTLTPAPFGERRDQAQHPVRQRAAKNLEPGAVARLLAEAAPRPAAARESAPGSEGAGGAFGFPADVNAPSRQHCSPSSSEAAGQAKVSGSPEAPEVDFPPNKGTGAEH